MKVSCGCSGRVTPESGPWSGVTSLSRSGRSGWFRTDWGMDRPLGGWPLLQRNTTDRREGVLKFVWKHHPRVRRDDWTKTRERWGLRDLGLDRRLLPVQRSLVGEAGPGPRTASTVILQVPVSPGKGSHHEWVRREDLSNPPESRPGRRFSTRILPKGKGFPCTT